MSSSAMLPPGQSALEQLSNELFDNIFGHIAKPQDLDKISRTSKTIYHRAITRLYTSFSYLGLKHDQKSLRIFIQTINWRPDLAAHVRTLDVREWGDCPKLEDYVGMAGGWSGHENESVDGSREGPERWEDEEDDEDYEVSNSSNPESDDSLEEEIEDNDVPMSETGNDPEDTNELFNISGDGDWHKFVQSRFYDILRKDAEEHGLDRDVLVNYHKAMNEQDERILIALLLCSLPNLQTLYMVVPELRWDDPLQKILFEEFAKKESKILQKLETLYYCSSLRIGPKGHREYYFELEETWPFIKLPSLKALYTLTAHTYDDLMNFKEVDFPAVNGNSNITTLVFDEADLAIGDALKALSIPKALETFKWQQQISCYSIGTCYGPFYKYLGQALLQHKNTLGQLELDIRHRYCRGSGHAANPYGTEEQRRQLYTNPDEAKRDSNKIILIGSLKDFIVLRELTIHAEALCGHKDWCPASIRMIDALPSSLESLKILAQITQLDGQGTSYENKYLEEHLLELLHGYKNGLPNLQEVKINILVWRIPSRASVHAPPEPKFCSEQKLSTEARSVGLKFQVYFDVEHVKTNIPFFGEQVVNRNPGRDY
ncbi:hypothetical protein BGZ60DRAFT_429955 [Tricladium varicosporioides]|nr:hypothetical protein BGZ60DRAFT_429955 [Hymenoscyphus varicosporioides]